MKINSENVWILFSSRCGENMSIWHGMCELREGKWGIFKVKWFEEKNNYNAVLAGKKDGFFLENVRKILSDLWAWISVDGDYLKVFQRGVL